jgi:hypothetical protein
MTGGIIVAGLMIAMLIVLSIAHAYDYHTDLWDIAYQLSRITDTLGRREKDEDSTING